MLAQGYILVEELTLRVKMRPQSAKSKGRRLQQFVRDAIMKAFPNLKKGDVRSTPMGVSGSDIMLSPAAREVFPYNVECKNVEKLNIWKAIEQAKEGDEGDIPIVIFKKNNADPMVAMPFEHFMELLNAK